MHKSIKNLVGQTFGKLTITTLLPERYGKRKEISYFCNCECGGQKKVLGGNLRSGKVNSCGCLTKNPPNKIQNRQTALRKLHFGNFKCNTRNKEKGISLSYKQFLKLSQSNCFYCGCGPSNQKKDLGKNGNISEEIFKYSGIDRIENHKGYSIENCVPCCKICNFLKGELSQSEFLTQIFKIHERLKSWKS